MSEIIPELNFPPDFVVKTTERHYVVRRRTLDDYARTLDLAISYRGILPGARGKASTGNGKQFAGTDPDEYRNMLRDGWPEGIEGAEGLDGLVSDRLERFQLQRNVAGSFANVPAHLAGHPAAMYEMRVAQSEKHGITLVVDLSFKCLVTQETVKAYLRTIMRLVTCLQVDQIEKTVH